MTSHPTCIIAILSSIEARVSMTYIKMGDHARTRMTAESDYSIEYSAWHISNTCRRPYQGYDKASPPSVWVK